MKLRQPGGLVRYRPHDGKPRTGAARWAAVPRTCHIMLPLGGVLFSRHCFHIALAPIPPSPTSGGGSLIPSPARGGLSDNPPQLAGKGEVGARGLLARHDNPCSARCRHACWSTPATSGSRGQPEGLGEVPASD